MAKHAYLLEKKHKCTHAHTNILLIYSANVWLSYILQTHHLIEKYELLEKALKLTHVHVEFVILFSFT